MIEDARNQMYLQKSLLWLYVRDELAAHIRDHELLLLILHDQHIIRAGLEDILDGAEALAGRVVEDVDADQIADEILAFLEWDCIGAIHIQLAVAEREDIIDRVDALEFYDGQVFREAHALDVELAQVFHRTGKIQPDFI